jgi:hypothetical protein
LRRVKSSPHLSQQGYGCDVPHLPFRTGSPPNQIYTFMWGPGARMPRTPGGLQIKNIHIYVGPETRSNGSGSKHGAECTQNQPRRPSIRPKNGAERTHNQPRRPSIVLFGNSNVNLSFVFCLFCASLWSSRYMCHRGRLGWSGTSGLRQNRDTSTR